MGTFFTKWERAEEKTVKERAKWNEKKDKEGKIVVTFVQGHKVLRRIMRDKQGLLLWAENHTWSNEARFLGRDFEVLGVAEEVMKTVPNGL